MSEILFGEVFPSFVCVFRLWCELLPWLTFRSPLASLHAKRGEGSEEEEEHDGDGVHTLAPFALQENIPGYFLNPLSRFSISLVQMESAGFLPQVLFSEREIIEHNRSRS